MLSTSFRIMPKLFSQKFWYGLNLPFLSWIWLLPYTRLLLHVAVNRRKKGRTERRKEGREDGREEGSRWKKESVKREIDLFNLAWKYIQDIFLNLKISWNDIYNMIQRYENLILVYVYIYESYCIEKNSKCNFTKLLSLGRQLELIGAGIKGGLPFRFQTHSTCVKRLFLL